MSDVFATLSSLYHPFIGPLSRLFHVDAPLDTGAVKLLKENDFAASQFGVFSVFFTIFQKKVFRGWIHEGFERGKRDEKDAINWLCNSWVHTELLAEEPTGTLSRVSAFEER